MERKTNEPSLMDAMVCDMGDPKMAAKLDRLDKAVPWEKLAEPVRATYANDRGAGGRPNVPVIMMIKAMMLQKWFNLSDAGAEAAILDRLSFRRFLGVGLTDVSIDETTFVRFRKRLRENGLATVLFDMCVEHLRSEGLIVNEGTIVDATIIEAPRGETRGDGLTSTRDPGATFTKKHGRTYHGYKAHVATDLNGVITDYVYDTAATHDSQHADQLLANERVAAFLDSAYMDAKRKADLEKRGVFCGIIERRVRGQAELTPEQKKHNALCSRFRAFVEHPFAWMKQFGSLCRTRYRGVSRNALDFVLTAITYNFRKSFSLSDALAEEAAAEKTMAA